MDWKLVCSMYAISEEVLESSASLVWSDKETVKIPQGLELVKRADGTLGYCYA